MYLNKQKRIEKSQHTSQYLSFWILFFQKKPQSPATFIQC